MDNLEVFYECLRLRARIEDHKLPLTQRDEAVEDWGRHDHEGVVRGCCRTSGYRNGRLHPL